MMHRVDVKMRLKVDISITEDNIPIVRAGQIIVVKEVHEKYMVCLIPITEEIIKIPGQYLEFIN